jgi:hypothetical protein
VNLVTERGLAAANREVEVSITRSGDHRVVAATGRIPSEQAFWPAGRTR